MSWFNKKEEKKPVSNLPTLPELPELPNIDFLPTSIQPKPDKPMQLQSLPSFPNSESANRMSQVAIKSAFSDKSKAYAQEIDSPGQEEGKLRWAPEKVQVREVESLPHLPEMPRTRESNQPIFVRIDKFQLAMKNLSEIKKQITDIEAYLNEVKRVRAKEEQEMQEWEHEIIDTKNKLEAIDKMLFSKME